MPLSVLQSEYQSITALSKETDLPYNSLVHFIARNSSVEVAVEKCREEQKKELVLWGNRFENYPDIAEFYGINITSIRSGLSNGYSVEETILNILKREPIIVEGVTYRNCIDLCESYQIQPANFYERIRYGMEVERALTQPIRKVANGNQSEYDGTIYLDTTSYPPNCGFSLFHSCGREIAFHVVSLLYHSG